MLVDRIWSAVEDYSRLETVIPETGDTGQVSATGCYISELRNQRYASASDGIISQGIDAHRSFSMDWVPVVLVTFKALVLGIAMFLAIKWHYDQGENGDRRALLRTGGKMAAVFVLAVICFGLVAFVLGRVLGLDLSLP